MNDNLLGKCIEYGVAGEGKQLLERLESMFESLDESKTTLTMCEYIEDITEEKGLRELSDEQRFFCGVGILLCECATKLVK